MKNGLLLINLGTPDKPDIRSVRRFLREFLADYRVITLPGLLRYLLLYGFILPFRPKSVAHAYQSIWTNEGSPLLTNSTQLITKLASRLGNNYKVALGMRYGKPSIQSALKALSGCENLTILPLYPQYASATTGSSIEKTLSLIASQHTLPTLKIIRDFHQHPSFIEAQAALIKPHLATHDYILFSYHGLPERHLINAGCKQVCQERCLPINNENPTCYRAQCYQTTQALANKLDLMQEKYSISFQSRLGKTPWLQPHTDIILPDLIQRGIERIAIVCPSFTADCLETLEEIGIRARKQWQALGGEQLTLIPCVNDSEEWVEAIITICELSSRFKT